MVILYNKIPCSRNEEWNFYLLREKDAHVKQLSTNEQDLAYSRVPIEAQRADKNKSAHRCTSTCCENLQAKINKKVHIRGS